MGKNESERRVAMAAFSTSSSNVNTVAAELFASLATLHGIWIRRVHGTISTLDGTESMSTDGVAFRGGDRYRGGDRWWLELRWIRDPLNTDAIIVQGARPWWRDTNAY